VTVTWGDAPLRLDDHVCEPKAGLHVIEVGLEADSLRVLCP
jgi:hypothetical protein